MDNPFSPEPKRNISERGRFCRPLPPVPAEGEQSLTMISSKKVGGMITDLNKTLPAGWSSLINPKGDSL
jgi:hypothetical protein